MKVDLTITKGNTTRYFTLKPSAGDALPCITVTATETVGAKIILEANEAGGLFILQVPCPDVQAQVEIQTGLQHGKFIYYKSLRIGRQRTDAPVESFPLFQGLLGPSRTFLQLIQFPDGKDSEEVAYQLAEIHLLPDKQNPCEGFLDIMITDLLQGKWVHYVVDDIKGQMERNHFSPSWESGYTSYDNEEVMLDAVCKVVASLSPWIRSICSAPRLAFARELRRRPVPKFRKVDAVSRRSLLRLQRMGGIASTRELNSFSATTTCKRVTSDVPAHAVMRFFFSDLLHRCRIILRALRKREYQCRKAGPRAYLGKKAQTRVRAADVPVLEELSRKIGRARQIDAEIRSILREPILAGGHGLLTVFDVDSGEFMATEAYRQAYMQMLHFSRCSFWWIKDSDNPWKRIPRLQLADKAGESRLQVKYSLVYENWCFCQLVEALRGLGYQDMSHAALSGCDGSCRIFSRNGIEVVVQHGVKTEKSGYFQLYGRRQYTPDFAIIVTRSGQNKSQWFVADAKSDGSMHPRMAEARNKYVAIETDGHAHPFASILFRSGEDDSSMPGVEFPPPIRGDDPEEPHWEDQYKWKAGEGVVAGKDQDPPYHGHLRVNASSFAKQPDIFKEFIEGMIATACRLMYADEERDRKDFTGGATTV